MSSLSSCVLPRDVLKIIIQFSANMNWFFVSKEVHKITKETFVNWVEEERQAIFEEAIEEGYLSIVYLLLENNSFAPTAPYVHELRYALKEELEKRDYKEEILKELKGYLEEMHGYDIIKY